MVYCGVDIPGWDVLDVTQIVAFTSLRLSESHSLGLEFEKELSAYLLPSAGQNSGNQTNHA